MNQVRVYKFGFIKTKNITTDITVRNPALLSETFFIASRTVLLYHFPLRVSVHPSELNINGLQFENLSVLNYDYKDRTACIGVL